MMYHSVCTRAPADRIQLFLFDGPVKFITDVKEEALALCEDEIVASKSEPLTDFPLQIKEAVQVPMPPRSVK